MTRSFFRVVGACGTPSSVALSMAQLFREGEAKMRMLERHILRPEIPHYVRYLPVPENPIAIGVVTCKVAGESVES